MTDIIPISVVERPVRRLYLGQGSLHSRVKTAEYPSLVRGKWGSVHPNEIRSLAAATFTPALASY